jgi:proteic killer suppression protein
MKIFFQKDKFRKQCEDPKQLTRAFGSKRADRILQRLDELRAASNLAERLPGRMHALIGNRFGQFSIDLDGPYRLIFEPCEEPLIRLPDGGIDRSQVTEIRIIEIADTHE